MTSTLTSNSAAYHRWGQFWPTVRTIKAKFAAFAVIFGVAVGFLGVADSGTIQKLTNWLLPFDVDTQCHPVEAARDEPVCTAFRRCDQYAGHPLDPVRLNLGWARGPSIDFMPNHLQQADESCRAVLDRYPSLRTTYSLFRIRYAQKKQLEANKYAAEAANGGYPMGLFERALNLLQHNDAKAARLQLLKIVEAAHPPPGSLLTLAELMACGVGGASDLVSARTIIDRAMVEITQYIWVPVEISEMGERQKQIYAWSLQDQQSVCEQYQRA